MAKISFFKYIIRLVLILYIVLYSNDISSQIVPNPSKIISPRSASVLSKGNWYKIGLIKTGVYKIDFQYIATKLKISTDDIRFSTFGIFGYGNGTLPEDNAYNFYEDLPENAIEIYDANLNDRMDPEDYILFYAKGSARWDYVNNGFKHTSPFYSDIQYYFISTTEGSGKKISTYNQSGSPQSIILENNDYSIYEKDSVNPNNTGRLWFDSPLSQSEPFKKILLPNEYFTVGKEVKLILHYYNTIQNGTISLSQNNIMASSFTISKGADIQKNTISFIANSEKIELNIELSNATEGFFYLDKIEVLTTQPIIFRNNPLNFRTTSNIGNNNVMQFNIINSGKNIKIWQVYDEINPQKVSFTGTSSQIQFLFSNNTLKEFVAFDINTVYIPSYFGKIANQNIKGMPVSYNTIIVPKAWKDEAVKLASFHKEIRNIETNIIDIDEIYNEFSSGRKDIMAIRNMMRYFYKQRTPSNAPKTLLLFGDASIDFKNIGKGALDFIPTFETIFPQDFSESYCTDDFFGLLDDTESSLNSTSDLDIGIGRLPVNSIQEATIVFNKIKAYKDKASYGEWRNISTIIADDVDDAADYDFFKQSEEISKRILDTNKIKSNLEKIYLDAFKQEQFSGGQRYDDADKLLKNRMTFGSLLMTYIGHGGSSGWSQERILTLKDIELYKNINNLPFITTATCGFAPYDKPNGEKSAGEKFLLQFDGGAIAMMTTSREVYITDQNRYMNIFVDEFYKKNINNESRDFGEIAKNTKNRNRLDVNSQKIVLLGDPALQINKPKFNVVTTSISNGNNDTIKSLSEVTIKGEVRDLNNTTISDFNGFCTISIFDKKQNAQTNDNDNQLNGKKDTFTIQNNLIFKGNASVSNGTFSIKFIVPKDINYAIGYGKISYYAADVNQKPYRDASGMDSIIIGGANLNAKTDNTPPQVRLFMNDENFGFGGITNPNPILIAKLFDDNGINTSSSSIGHDIEAILDNNTKYPIVLNTYYQSELDDYKRGFIKYPYYNLTEGKHSIKVKAWDVYNNLGEGYIEFIVSSSAEIALNKVLNYPNPFTTNTYFQFEHNKPGELLDVNINILSISGKVVKSIHQKIVTEGFRVDKQISWDGRDEYGDRIGKGAYIYQVSIRDSKGNNATKYEKLVLLQ